jgi:hypothetical protein
MMSVMVPVNLREPWGGITAATRSTLRITGFIAIIESSSRGL